MIVQLLAVLAFSTVYAVMRYTLFGDVSLMHLPAYLMNKSLSTTAVVSLFLAVWSSGRGARQAAEFWAKAFSHLLFLHILLSLALLSKGYYAKLFEGDRMNLTGEAMLLFGVLAAWCFRLLGAADLKQTLRTLLTLVSGLLVAGHLFVMGYHGWTQPAQWHGGLPPISLLCFLLVISGWTLFLTAKSEKNIVQPGKEGR